MSSYNNIRKIKYTKNPTDIVTLHEYIIFEDSHAKEKYVVFKFSNNVNQRLLGFKFEVLQYNKDNELLEKSVVVHENFVAEANDLFVPNAKLKINFECESLEVRLESASFDRVIWSDGEFKDNSYRFEQYAETLTKKGEKPAPAAESKQHQKAAEPKQNKNKLDFSIKNIFRRNKAVFPAVFNVILCVIVIGFVIFSTFYFKRVTGAFAVGDFILEESSPGYVSIVNYTGNSESVTIPSNFEDGRYYVIKIAKGAFGNSTVKGVEFKTEKSLTIETGAFANCGNLASVTGTKSCGDITLMEGAFTDCSALTSFTVSTAQLCRKCFDGTNNITILVFDSVVFSDGKLLDIFNGISSITLDNILFNITDMDVPDSFFDGVTFRR